MVTLLSRAWRGTRRSRSIASRTAALTGLALAIIAVSIVAAPAQTKKQVRKVGEKDARAAPVQQTPAKVPPGQYATRARNAILMEAETGAVLYAHNADEPFPPASMSKLMTLAVAFDAIKSGKLKLTDEIRMSEYAWRNGGAPSGTSAMMVPLGTRERVELLLQGVIVQSGNDAAISLAEGLAGNEARFSELQNAHAKKLGLKRSTFRNATGLPHPEQQMSARDLALLARHIIKEYPEFYTYFAQKEFQYRRHKFINRNRLIFLQPGVDGLKTGFTREAGYCIVASAKVENRRLIAVVAGLTTDNERVEEGKRIFEWGFRNFGEFKLFDANEVIGKARVYGGSSFYVPLVGNGEINVFLPRYAAGQKLNAEIIYQGPLKPPIKKGDQIATLRVTTSAAATNEVPLYAGEDIGKGGVASRGIDSLLYLAFRWAKL